MTIRDFIKLLRTRWLIICITIAVMLLGAAAVNFLTTPLYEASTRLFVSTTSGTSATEIYQGNRYAQERVTSYTELLRGETVAQRTIDKLDLDLTATELANNVKATSKSDTVLIDVKVTDPSPVRARDIADALSEEFVELVRELETPPDGTPPDARVVIEQRASIPDKPVVPRTARNFAIALALGIVVGVGLALFRDLLDNTVKDRDTLEKITGVGLVGNIPLDKDRRREPAITFENDNSAIAEAFRKLRTNLQFLAVDNPPQVIIVTSSMPSEGKSTTSTNLALALAEADHDVVMVEGDLRRPRLHTYLGLVGTVGLSTVLTGQVSVEDALQKTRFPRLSVLTSGALPPNPSELLGSRAAKSVLDELRTKFDYVIVDTSPLVAVTDAAILATAADGVLMIARFGHTKRDHIAHAIENLRSVGAPILGTVLTMAPLRGHSTYRYSYYGETAPQRHATASDSGLIRKRRHTTKSYIAGKILGRREA